MSSRRPRVADAVASVELDGVAVLFHTGSGRSYVLDPTGTLVWRFLDGRTSVEELASDVADVMGVPLTDARRDIDAFIRSMNRRHLLVEWRGAAKSAGQGEDHAHGRHQ